MRFEDFKGMPSGTDYGTVMNWSLLDDGDFVVAFFVKGTDTESDEFSWVVEHKSGDVIYLSKKAPFYRPIFGLDEREWWHFKNEVLDIVDAYIEENK